MSGHPVLPAGNQRVALSVGRRASGDPHHGPSVHHIPGPIGGSIRGSGLRRALGSGWLFPGSYPRITSFVMGARSSVKIVVALVPFFFFASFIESYITRLSDKDMALPVNLAIIFGTMALILLYFVYLPVKVHNAEIHTDN